MPIYASRLRCWQALNHGFRTFLLRETCPRIQYSSFSMADSELNPSQTEQALNETLGQPSKRRRLDEPSTVDQGGDRENDGEVARNSSNRQIQKGKEKEKKRGRGRGRQTREEVGREIQLDEEGNVIPKALRYPKRQCALLLGFCGSGYSGMQMCCLDYLNIIWRILMSYW